MSEKRIKKIIQLSKSLKNYEEMIDILSYEIEENIFDNNDDTYVNFIVTKKENTIIDDHNELQADFVRVSYSESAKIPEELAIKLQNEVLKYYKKKKREILKEIKQL